MSVNLVQISGNSVSHNKGNASDGTLNVAICDDDTNISVMKSDIATMKADIATMKSYLNNMNNIFNDIYQSSNHRIVVLSQAL